MSNRLDENKMLMKFLMKKADEKPEGTFEEMTVWNLGTIGSVLADISKSLAIIADSMSREEGDGE